MVFEMVKKVYLIKKQATFANSIRTARTSKGKVFNESLF
jgi:hypothetical protein